ncbi:MAG TPA: hypothetical protein VEW69_09685 [Alphaproteobacteria bacterium]|nr:hypothetical protein [Alphaproteobacteria bacterium]
MLPRCFNILALKSGLSNVVMLQAAAAPGNAIKSCSCDYWSSLELLLVSFIFIVIELVHSHTPKAVHAADMRDSRRVTDWSRHKEFRRALETVTLDANQHDSDKG